MFKFEYGILNNYIDITDLVYQKCIKNNIIEIPKFDLDRSIIFGDPLNGILKNIKIVDVENNIEKIFYDGELILININNKFTNNTTTDYYNFINTNKNLTNIDKLDFLHSKLNFKNGSLKDEYPEQLMVISNIDKNDVVLEIGSNIGRNSLIISSLLNNNQNLVTMECNLSFLDHLYHNKFINNTYFHIENSALSLNKLIYREIDCTTFPSDVLLDGHKEISIISFDELQKKYNMIFNTIVADCEGALLQILIDFPNLLNNITKIIMENDYHDIKNKNKLDEILLNNNFNITYQESGGWGPCQNNFFEVWKK